VRITIGTRGSQLALTQSNAVRDSLLQAHGQLDVQVEIIRTHGDVTTGSLRSFGGQGVFTKEIEAALLDGRIDLAVHSLKDLPTDTHPELQLAAIPSREDVRDILVAPGCDRLTNLPQGATVGTGSLRRRAQLLALRPDLALRDIRGNLDTRIARAEDGNLDAVVLAAAGMHRLGWAQRISFYLEPLEVLPAVGQAALGLQTRRGDAAVDLVSVLNHEPTHQAITAERSLLQALGGGCHAPIGAWARMNADSLVIDGSVGSPDGTLMLRHQCQGAPQDAAALGQELAAALREMGAGRILDELASWS
jgi:hydroxymethylbilane synthase